MSYWKPVLVAVTLVALAARPPATAHVVPGQTHGHGHSHHGHHHHHHDDAHHHHHHHEPDDHHHYHRKVMVARHQQLDETPAADYAAWTQALLATAVIGLAPILIVYFIPSHIGHRNERSQNLLKVLLSFAVGGLLGDVFLHLLPHAMEGHSHDGNPEHGHQHGVTGFWVLTGILLFLAIEKFILTFSPSGAHGHSHSPKHDQATTNDQPRPLAEPTPASSTEVQGLRKRRKDAPGSDARVTKTESHPVVEKSIAPAAYLNIAADFTHNFTDGLAIGSSFLVDSKVGLVTVLAILLHEIPHEIGDFAILIQAGVSPKAAMRMQVWTAVGALLGTVIGLMTEGATPESAWILPMTAGGFLYIAMSSAIPEILKKASPMQSIKEMSAILMGIGLMATVSLIE